MSVVGGALSAEFQLVPAVVHASAVSAALYVAHLRDAYVDAHLRSEEEPLLSARGNRVATAVANVLFLGTLTALWVLVGPVAAAITAPLWLLAVLHAPYLDTHALTVTVDYPVGIAIALVGGHVVQGNGLDEGVLAIGALLVVTLSTTKVSVDRPGVRPVHRQANGRRGRR
jgi:hypothetical protein